MSIPKKPIHATGNPGSHLSLLLQAVFPTAEVVRVMAQSAFNEAIGWARAKTVSPLRAPTTTRQPRA